MLNHDIDALAVRVQDRSAKGRAKRIADLTFRAKTIGAYRRLLLDPGGTMKADAVRMLADLSSVARMGVADSARLSTDELRARAAMRNLILHLFARMDLTGAALADVNKKLKELGNE